MNEENVKVVTWEEVEPELFPDQPDVLDKLGLAKQRRKMTAAQNDMIKMKHDIMRELETGYLSNLKAAGNQAEEDPFDFSDSVPDTNIYMHEKMARAVRLSALRNPEYRKSAKEYLNDLIPVFTAKEKELIDGIDSLSEELARIQDDYAEKIQVLENQLGDLRHDVSAAADRFYLTDTGSAKQGGLVPCEQPDPSLWIMAYRSRYDVDMYLDTLMEMIAKLEEHDDGYDRITVAKSNFKTHVRLGSGSAAPVGASAEDGGAIRKMLGNLFS